MAGPSQVRVAARGPEPSRGPPSRAVAGGPQGAPATARSPPDTSSSRNLTSMYSHGLDNFPDAYGVALIPAVPAIGQEA
ncbi:hypothetical protein GCM10022224_084830 [Nonomuraea antimicrobica]|uniref:Uncharacterized protein n=1 Tax=Nonomuraea antimicrobica TaxID=561173 RepID=A0ABP7DM45_9ACTN